MYGRVTVDLSVECLGLTGDSWSSSAMSRQYQPVSTLENGKAEDQHTRDDDAEHLHKDADADADLHAPQVPHVAATGPSNAANRNKNVVTFSLGADQVLFSPFPPPLYIFIQTDFFFFVFCCCYLIEIIEFVVLFTCRQCTTASCCCPPPFCHHENK